MELIHTDQQENVLKRENSLRDLWDKIIWANKHIIVILEREKREKAAEVVYEEMTADTSLIWGKLYPGPKSPEMSK